MKLSQSILRAFYGRADRLVLILCIIVFFSISFTMYILDQYPDALVTFINNFINKPITIKTPKTPPPMILLSPPDLWYGVKKDVRFLEAYANVFLMLGVASGILIIIAELIDLLFIRPLRTIFS